MKIRHFVLDSHAQLRKLSRQAVHEILNGRVSAQAFDPALVRELRLVTAVCHDDLTPQDVFLLRVPLTEGVFTTEDRLTLRAFADPECVTEAEAVRHYMGGWPGDLIRQLAVVMDVPAAAVEAALDVGGPVFVAAVRGVTVKWATREIG